MQKIREFIQSSPILITVLGIVLGIILILLILFTPQNLSNQSTNGKNGRPANNEQNTYGGGNKGNTQKDNINSPNTQTGENNNPQAKNQLQINQPKITSAPQVVIKSYKSSLNESAVTTPKPLVVYTVTPYSDRNWILGLAKALDAAQTVKEYSKALVTYTKTSSMMRMLTVDYAKNRLSFITTEGIKLPEGDKYSILLSFAQSLGYTSPTLTVSSSYRKSSISDVVFYEIQHSWTKLNAPLLSAYGLENIPDNAQPSKLSLATPLASWAKNDDIYGTTDGTDGYERRNDFNTLTIGVRESTNEVYFVDSTLNQIAPQTFKPSISFQQAKTLLDQKKEAILLVRPAGTGTVAWSKAFPENRANATTATIQDAVLAYLDSTHLSTSSLEPYWIMTGEVDLASGYRGRFLSAVPASQNAQARSPLVNLLIPPAQAQETSQKQSTFEVPTVLPSNIPSPSDSTTPTTPDSCIPPESALNPIYPVKDFKIGFYSEQNAARVIVPTINRTFPTINLRSTLSGTPFAYPTINYSASMPARPNEWYYVPGRSIDIATFKQDYEYAKSQFQSILSANNNNDAQSGSRATFSRNLNLMVGEATLHLASQCPTRITGSSPSLFVYNPSSLPLTLNLSEIATTYTDPPLSQAKTWEVGNTKTPYYYYEYTPHSFSRPTDGWNIKRSELDELTNNIAQYLKLTSKEQSRLSFELHHAAADINDEDLFVGLINEEEINQALPIKISNNQFTVTRLHFYIGSVIGQVKEPALTPITRPANLILEIGSSSGREQ